MPVFPSQNLNSQKICESYPKLLQIYDTGIVLDGTGSQVQFLNLTASYALNCNCPSGSGGGTILHTGSTYPITASYALNCLCPPGESVTGSFCSSSVWTFNHNLGSQYVIVQTYDENDNQIIPEVINLYDENTAIIAFGVNACGKAIASLGGRTVVSKSYYLGTGSLYPITSSWSINSLSASYAPCNCPIMQTGSTYPITASWALYTVTSSYIQVSNVSYPIKTVTSDYNVVKGDYTILCNASGGRFDVKLPSATSVYSQIFNIKKIDTTGNHIHVYTSAGNYIDYDLTQSIAHRGTNMSVQSDGTQYWIL